MRKLLCIAAVAAVLAACAEQVGPGSAPDEDEDPIVLTPTDPDSDNKRSTDQPGNQRAAADHEPNPGNNVCDLLPAGDGACAHACDPVALAAFIPEGTCVTFTCTLTDGSTFRTGGCNN